MENFVKEMELIWEGDPQKVWAEKINGVLWVHGSMGTLSYEPERRSYGSASEGSGDEIRAPMPGKIKKVLRTSGESVAAGQTVLVMEAMKMEFELKAPREAQIQSVDCQEGDQVALHQLLVQFDLKGES